MTNNKLIHEINWICMINLFFFSGFFLSCPLPIMLNSACEVKLETTLYKSKSDQSKFKILSNDCAIEALSIKVSDKYGDLVFESNQLDFEWDITENPYAIDGASFSYLFEYKINEDADLKAQEGYIFIWD